MRYTYDQNGLRIGRKLPAGQSESYVYDAAGDLKSKTDFNAKTTTYAYDKPNRLLSKTPDASFHAPQVAFPYTPVRISPSSLPQDRSLSIAELVTKSEQE